MKKIFIKSLIANALLIGLSSSFATTVTSSLPVSGTLNATCVINSGGSIAFGTFAPTDSPAGNNSFSITCTNTTPWTMAMNAGTTSGGTISQRLMANGANTIGYNVYKDSGYTTLFGNGTTGSTVTGTGNGSAQLTTYYFKISTPGNIYNTPGAYSDTLTLTLSY